MGVVHGPSLTPGREIVVFEWNTQLGRCYECGLPAAFWVPDAYRRADGTRAILPRDQYGVAFEEKRCSICAANDAADGERVARILTREES